MMVCSSGKHRDAFYLLSCDISLTINLEGGGGNDYNAGKGPMADLHIFGNSKSLKINYLPDRKKN